MSFDGRCVSCQWPHHPNDGVNCLNCKKPWDFPAVSEEASAPASVVCHDPDCNDAHHYGPIHPAPDTAPTAKPHREICGLCHNVSPIGFHVPDDVWKLVVHHSRLQDIHCLRCFTQHADEKSVEWARTIKFYPVSRIMHDAPDASPRTPTLDAVGTESTPAEDLETAAAFLDRHTWFSTAKRLRALASALPGMIDLLVLNRALKFALEATEQRVASLETDLATSEQQLADARRLAGNISPADANGVRSICLGYHEETQEYEWLNVIPESRCATLEADRARLDWLDKHCPVDRDAGERVWVMGDRESGRLDLRGETLREALDAASSPTTKTDG